MTYPRSIIEKVLKREPPFGWTSYQGQYDGIVYFRIPDEVLSYLSQDDIDRLNNPEDYFLTNAQKGYFRKWILDYVLTPIFGENLLNYYYYTWESRLIDDNEKEYQIPAYIWFELTDDVQDQLLHPKRHSYLTHLSKMKKIKEKQNKRWRELYPNGLPSTRKESSKYDGKSSEEFLTQENIDLILATDR